MYSPYQLNETAKLPIKKSYARRLSSARSFRASLPTSYLLPDLAIITKPIRAVVLLLRRTMNIAWLLTDQSNCILLLRLRGLHDYL